LLSSTSWAEAVVDMNIPAKKLNTVPHKTLNFDFINFAIFNTPPCIVNFIESYNG
jgi:hypothetical protein